MYRGLSARVKWESEVRLSVFFKVFAKEESFLPIFMAHFYKTYLNDFLLELESRALRKFIGGLYMGCPTLADDLLFLTSSDTKLQLVFNLAYINSQEKIYTTHSQKTIAQRRKLRVQSVRMNF